MGWSLLIVIGIVLIAIVLFVAMNRNKSDRAGIERSEQATDRLYKEEDAARDPMDDGTV